MIHATSVVKRFMFRAPDGFNMSSKTWTGLSAPKWENFHINLSVYSTWDIYLSTPQVSMQMMLKIDDLQIAFTTYSVQ